MNKDLLLKELDILKTYFEEVVLEALATLDYYKIVEAYL